MIAAAPGRILPESAYFGSCLEAIEVQMAGQKNLSRLYNGLWHDPAQGDLRDLVHEHFQFATTGVGFNAGCTFIRRPDSAGYRLIGMLGLGWSVPLAAGSKMEGFGIAPFTKSDADEPPEFYDFNAAAEHELYEELKPVQAVLCGWATHSGDSTVVTTGREAIESIKAIGAEATRKNLMIVARKD